MRENVRDTAQIDKCIGRISRSAQRK